MTDWRPGRLLALESENYTIRSMTTSDISDTYISWWNDPEIQESLGFGSRGWNREQSIRYVRTFDNRHRLHLLIFPKESAIPIGHITILTKSKGIVQTNTIIGDTSYWGKRVPLEVREVVLKFVFERMDAHKVCGEVDSRNFASIYNYKAQGFKCEGILREHVYWIDDTWRDQLRFGLLRDEWIAQQAGAAE